MKENVKYEFGCIMGILNQKASKTLLDISKKLIPNNVLYEEEEDQDYGREKEMHVTCKFGLTKNYSKKDMGKVISHIKPFLISISGITTFNNEKFDVIKIDVKSTMLTKLNKMFSKLPNEDEHPIYRPHITLAYVNPGKGNKFIREFNSIELIINRIKYSNPIGRYFYDL